jgi:imidazolonepropionase-like amidohydrolase
MKHLLLAGEALGRTRDVGALAPGRFGDIVAATGDRPAT